MNAMKANCNSPRSRSSAPSKSFIRMASSKFVWAEVEATN